MDGCTACQVAAGTGRAPDVYGVARTAIRSVGIRTGRSCGVCSWAAGGECGRIMHACMRRGSARGGRHFDIHPRVCFASRPRGSVAGAGAVETPDGSRCSGSARTHTLQTPDSEWAGGSAPACGGTTGLCGVRSGQAGLSRRNEEDPPIPSHPPFIPSPPFIRIPSLFSPAACITSKLPPRPSLRPRALMRRTQSCTLASASACCSVLRTRAFLFSHGRSPPRTKMTPPPQEKNGAGWLGLGCEKSSRRGGESWARKQRDRYRSYRTG
ncbi:hypothetical protein C8F04DRAFT_1149816 [Mycena alexandri]|uniref:Uncharacterized protein n=1 Tax=Mycena alexandri TaxID=1745969 RepID=A0AAD6S0A9_9AGAR|nr:hypothetical protein C8F04DRAFT_1149816 [Mycena alexandri]